MKVIRIELNARLQPFHRVEMFEEKLEKALTDADAGELLGGGTFQLNTGEIKTCDIELNVKEEWFDKVIDFIKQIRIIPKGSKIICGEDTIEIGSLEGMAIYLNGVELPAEVYQSNDINVLISCLDNAMNNRGVLYSWWEGSKETALYFYGNSFDEMKNSTQAVIEKHPLCQMCRIEKIA